MNLRTVVLADLSPDERDAIVRRSAVPDAATRAAAADIVEAVRVGGDATVREFDMRFGGIPADTPLSVDPADLAGAAGAVAPEVLAALDAATANIRLVHAAQRPADVTVEPAPGVSVVRRWTPLRRVGLYVPGGLAAYPSSLLMAAIPAQVAGVGSIAVVSPPGPDGRLDATVMAAAHRLGIDEVYATGGAQAIGALAHGTETIEPVDKIVGPGGAWVTAAKLAVYGLVGVDLPAGPSEAAILVDTTADPEVAAADLLCQAEHGPDSAVVLIATDPGVAEAVVSAAARQLHDLKRADIIAAALAEHGLVVVAADRRDALAFADAWAPEHLTVHTADPEADAGLVPSAGSVFLGHWTPESAGDYATGANHILPTGGLAASYGPLATEDFGSWRQLQRLTREGLEGLAPTIRSLAQAEGLTAHAACVDVRLEQR